ncbi:MAG: ATP-binding protein [Lachnospiraceae bacterium]|nr:ATP-binding protein [Lachnospiraceae bacterium]
MHIREIFPDVITEDLDYEYKQILNPDNPVKWAKTLVGYANGKGGVMFVGVSNEGEAFGSGTGFQTMIESYKDSDEHLQPVVSIYPGFLNLRLYDRLYEESVIEVDEEQFSDPKELIVEILKKEGPKLVKDLQARTKYNSRSQFLAEVLKTLMDADIIYRDGNPKSPTALIKIKL